MTRYIILAFVTFTLIAANATSTRPATFQLELDCGEEMFCASVAGKLSRATASLKGHTFNYTGMDSTCCQLAGGIREQICGFSSEMLDPVGVIVTCH